MPARVKHKAPVPGSQQPELPVWRSATERIPVKDRTDAARLRILDLIRGIAVLGILAINIASFADIHSATYGPRPHGSGGQADNLAYALSLILFEGKMRALFSILFGASLVLYFERASAAGRNGIVLQLRRLGWLALFGYLHFLLFWDGDILFLYACVGLATLPMRKAPPVHLVVAALLVFSVWQAWGVSLWADHAMAERAVSDGTASADQIRLHRQSIEDRRRDDAEELTLRRSGMAEQVADKLAERALQPLQLVFYMFGETFAYLLIGMALMRSSFFSGGWSRSSLWRMAVAGTGLGGGLTFAFAAWAQLRHYPESAMHLAINFGLGFPHLLMALGYAALIAQSAGRLLACALGQRLESAGRMAFTNYIGMTILMTAIFDGWGLGLFGQFGTAAQWPFILAGWTLMLGLSKPWLTHFTQGPLEWLWRSLTQWRYLPLR